MHPKVSFVVNMLNQKSNLITVAGQHDSRVARGINDGGDISMPVGSDLVRKITGVGANHVLDGFFISGRAGRMQQSLEKLQLGFIQDAVLQTVVRNFPVS